MTGSAGSPFPVLASPVSLGRLRLRNRIVCLAHGLNFAEPGLLRPTRRHLEYYAARARGGVGLVCLESSVASWDGQSAARLVISSDPGVVPGYREIARAVHAAGARVSGQITHFGLEAADALSRRPVIGPSSLPEPASGVVGRRMTREDMTRVSGDFVAAARNFVASGFDGVELKLAHDGLLRQFMSPLTNDRDDEYGGSTENRLRFPMEIALAVREAIPDHVALGIRLVVDECLPGGYGLDEGIAFARLLSTEGGVDYIGSDLGIAASISMVVPPMGVEEGYSEHAFSRLAAECDAPIVAFGQIRTPAYAERIVAEGRAAAVGMSRQMLADPDWAAKALAGTPERIRPCTSCNELCLRESSRWRPIGCTVNPHAGHGEHRRPAPGAPRARVVVVGGGPAGMEAARVSAEDGHEVVLIEARDALGGQLALAARARGRERWRHYLDWLEREVRRHGVDVRLGEPAGAAGLLAGEPDHVIVATGSTPEPPAGAGANVRDVDAYLAGEERGRTVAVVDCGAAGPALWMTAYEAACRGAEEVVLVTRLTGVAADLDGATGQWLRAQLATAPVRVLTDRAVRFTPAGLVAGALHGGEDVAVGGELIVTVGPRRSEDRLVSALAGAVAVSVIGDASHPRDLAAAVREGQAPLR